MAGVVGDLVDLIKPVVRALKNYRGDGLGCYVGDRGKFEPFEAVLVGEEGSDRGFLALGGNKADGRLHR